MLIRGISEWRNANLMNTMDTIISLIQKLVDFLAFCGCFLFLLGAELIKNVTQCVEDGKERYQARKGMIKRKLPQK